jgi:hypothetical protein
VAVLDRKNGTKRRPAPTLASTPNRCAAQTQAVQRTFEIVTAHDQSGR